MSANNVSDINAFSGHIEHIGEVLRSTMGVEQKSIPFVRFIFKEIGEKKVPKKFAIKVSSQKLWKKVIKPFADKRHENDDLLEKQIQSIVNCLNWNLGELKEIKKKLTFSDLKYAELNILTTGKIINDFLKEGKQEEMKVIFRSEGVANISARLRLNEDSSRLERLNMVANQIKNFVDQLTD